MSDRKRAIETLKQLRLDYEEFYEEHNNEVTQAYDMAIASLETDEAYQLEYEPTTKNDLPQCQCTDAKIAKSFIEDVEAVKDQLPTKNDLGVDWDELKRKILMEVDGGADDKWLRYADVCDRISGSIDDFKADLPSVTPQESQSFKWCDTCKEYDQEKHCCHRYSKVIRDTVAEIEQEPQESEDKE